MTELDSLDRALELVRAELSPSAADAVRVRAGLGLSQPRVVAPPSRQHTARAWRALRASGKAGLAAAAVIASVNFAAGYWLGLRHSPPGTGTDAVAHVDGEGGGIRTAPLSEPPELDSAGPIPLTPALDAAPRIEPASSARESSVPARSTRGSLRKPASAAEPSDEIALLRRVERALRAEEPAFALALLAELDERFANTALGEERQAAKVIAHCALHDPGAQLRAQNFLRDRPASVYSERVQRACARSASSEGSTVAGDE